VTLGFAGAVWTFTAFEIFTRIGFVATELCLLSVCVAGFALQVALSDRHIVRSISLSALIREDDRADPSQLDPSVNINDSTTTREAKLRRLIVSYS
jgi:hypothetical protein